MAQFVEVPGYNRPNRRRCETTETVWGRRNSDTQLVSAARLVLTRLVAAICAARSHGAPVLVRDSARQVTWSEAFLHDTSSERSELRGLVAQLAHAERVRGTPPEGMVVIVKELLPIDKADSLEWSEERALIEDVVRWGIEGYYDSESP